MLTPALQSFAQGAASFGTYLLAVLAVLRLPGKVSPVVRQSGLALLVHVATTVMAIRFLESIPYWHGAALFWCCFICTLFAYSAVYKSVSLGILSELARRDSHSLSMDEILEAYIWPSFIERTHILLAAGYVTGFTGRFQLTASGQRLAQRFAVIQKLFGVERSGLYTPASAAGAMRRPPIKPSSCPRPP